jgi:hypothetical protein
MDTTDRNNMVIATNHIVSHAAYGKPVQLARVLEVLPTRIKVRGLRFNRDGSVAHKVAQWISPRRATIVDRFKVMEPLLSVLDRDPVCSRCGK